MHVWQRQNYINSIGGSVFNLEGIVKRFAEKQQNSCFRGLSFAKIFLASNHGGGFNSIVYKKRWQQNSTA